MPNPTPLLYWLLLTLALASWLGAEDRCVLETDGVDHELPYVYVAREAGTPSGTDAPSAPEHWIFCTRHPIEPNEAYGDWPTAARIAILQLDEDDRVEVLVAGDGRVRRAGMTWGNLQAETLHDDPALPISFEGSIEAGHARGQVRTAEAIHQQPTPWHDADLHWRVSITIDTAILGTAP